MTIKNKESRGKKSPTIPVIRQRSLMPPGKHDEMMSGEGDDDDDEESSFHESSVSKLGKLNRQQTVIRAPIPMPTTLTSSSPIPSIASSSVSPARPGANILARRPSLSVVRQIQQQQQQQQQQMNNAQMMNNASSPRGSSNNVYRLIF